MSEKDFRYVLESGEEVEAFQMTPESRYAEKDWPVWMDSRWLMTVEGEEWLNINDQEQKIPEYGWIMNSGGAVTAVPYTLMEKATKVVEDAPAEVHPEVPVNEDALIELAARITKRDPDEIRKEQERKKKPALETVPTDTSSIGENHVFTLRAPAPPQGLLDEVTEAFITLASGATEKGLNELKAALAARTQWCNCPPGHCDESGGKLGCRKDSPLA